MATPKYDVYLGDKSLLQGFRCKMLTRDSAPLVAPKFGSSNQSQSDLDLLKSASIDKLSGGMFQRTHQDNTKTARQVGWFNAYDENIYPTIPTTTPTGSFQSGNVVSKVESENYSFYTTYVRSGGFSYNQICKVAGNTGTNLTMPAALTATASVLQVGQLCLHKGALFLACSPSSFYAPQNSYRYDIAANTFQDIGGGIAQFFTLRGVLYGINYSSALYTVTNELAAGAATFTQVATVGGVDQACLDAKEFNGAAWITKADGIYRFDGTTVLKILNLKATNLTVWNGALYFMVNKWLYSFNGSVVQKVQYFSDSIYQISSNSDYLFLQTWVTTSFIDSAKLPSTTGYLRLYSFNGVAFSIIIEKDTPSLVGVDHCLLYSSSYLTYVQPGIGGATWDTVNEYSINLANLFTSSAVGTTSQIDITSSEFDDSFPNIFKSLEAINVDFSDIVAGDVITVKYSLYDGRSWGSWITAGTLTSTSASPYIEITDYSNKLFKRVKINAYVSTLTAGSTLKIHGFSWRYTLQPRTRWRWQLDIYASGESVMNDRSGASITTASNYLKNFIDKALRQKTPQFLLTPDYGQVKTQITGAALSFDIQGQFPIYTDPYNEYPLIAVLNSNSVWEILRVSNVVYNSGTDTTTVTVLERGYLGIANAQINAAAEVHLCYKIYLTRLTRDSPVLDQATYNEQSTGVSQIQREFILEATEV